MIFLGGLNKITDTKYSIGLVHYKPFDTVDGLGKTQEQLEQEGALVENIPESQQVEGKQAIMYWNPTSKEIFYEYENIPKTQEQTQQEIIDQILIDNLNMQMQIDTLITSSL